MIPSYRIVFYISGHGFGHASRSGEVIRAVRRRHPDASLVVKTMAPARFFDSDVIAFQADTGMVQMDSVRVDVPESLARAAAFHASLAERARIEARFLRDHRASLVVGDIPALAFAAAAEAGIPSVALGNFTWDWIYAGYPEAPASLVDTIREAYAHATEVLRLPMGGGFEGLESKTRDIPFVARIATREPAEVRRALAVPEDVPLVVTAFGAYGLRDLNVAAVENL